MAPIYKIAVIQLYPKVRSRAQFYKHLWFFLHCLVKVGSGEWSW